MPAHLAFNLAWLWLFLRGGKAGHAGAIAVGFLATGIHQLIFHPMFVAPFVLQLWLRRRWGLGALYTLAYAAICLFWIEYWPLASWVSGVAPGDSDWDRRRLPARPHRRRAGRHVLAQRRHLRREHRALRRPGRTRCSRRWRWWARSR